MMRRLISAFLAVVLGVSAVTAGALPAFAANEFTNEACRTADADQRAALGCDDGNKTVPFAVTNIIKGIITVLGIVAVIVIVFGGQRYIVSQGDPGKIQQARGMIIYSLIGLIIAILAFAIVSFIQAQVFG